MQGFSVSEEDSVDQLISSILLFQEAERKGFAISSAELEELIESDLQAQGSSLEEFKQQIELYGESYDEILEQNRKGYAIGEYIESLIGDVPNVSDEDVLNYYNVAIEQFPEGEEIPPFEEVEDQIKSSLQQEVRNTMQQQILPSLLKELKQNASIVYFREFDSEVLEQNLSQQIPIEMEAN
jgi:hypothetical protein